MKLEGRKVTLHDMCLRDGMHPKQHQITVDQMVDIAGALDDAGVPLIEVTHGDGLGGASVNYGFPAASDETYLRAVVERVSQAGHLCPTATGHRYCRSSPYGGRLWRHHDSRSHALHRSQCISAAHQPEP